MSFGSGPQRSGLRKSLGGMGSPNESFNSGADGPCPSPFAPWHGAQAVVNNFFPFAARNTNSSASSNQPGGAGSGTGAAWFSGFAQRGENDFTYSATARTSVSRSVVNVGIAVPVSPPRIVRARSSSVGRKPDGVERNLKTASRKLRGRGFTVRPISPRPSPASPWQGTQFF